MNATTKCLDDCNELYVALHYLEHVFSDYIDGLCGVEFLGNIIPFDDAVVFVHFLSARKAYGRFQDFPEIPYRQIYDMDRDDAAAFQKSLSPERVREVFERARELEAAIGAAQSAMISAIRNRLNSLNLEYGNDLEPENLVPTWHRLSADYSALCYLIPELIEAVGEEEQLGQWHEVKDKITDAILAFRQIFDWDLIVAQGLEAPTLIIRAPGPESQAHLEDLRGLLTQASSMLEALHEALMVRVAKFFDCPLEDYIDLEWGGGFVEPTSIPSPCLP